MSITETRQPSISTQVSEDLPDSIREEVRRQVEAALQTHRSRHQRRATNRLQGYFLHEPMPFEQLTRLLRRKPGQHD